MIPIVMSTENKWIYKNKKIQSPFEKKTDCFPTKNTQLPPSEVAIFT